MLNKIKTKMPLLNMRKSLVEDPSMRMAIAIIAALLLWVVVVTFIQPNTDKTIDNVPVNFTYDSGAYTEEGLSIINDPSATVSIKVSGDGSVIGSLTKEDFIVYPDYSSVDSAGERSLKLLVKAASTSLTGVTVEITSATTSVDVVFDTVEEKTISIKLSAQDLEIADGYVLVKTEATPSQVVITGPTTELANITEVIATYTLEEELHETTTVEVTLQFFDDDGIEVEFVYVEPDIWETDVKLSVYKQVELPVSVRFINTPDDFDSSILKYSFSHATLNVMGNESDVDSLSEIAVGAIDLSTFALDKIYEMPIELPSGIELQDNISVITVSFDCSAMSTTTLNISNENVLVKNLPDSYQLEVETTRIMNVVLCGPTEAIEALAAGSVVATIDMDDFSIAVGSQTISVTISVPSNNQIFAIGSYTVQCKIESN